MVYGETKENLRRAATVRAAEQKAKQETTEPEKKGSGIKYAAISTGVTAAVLFAIGLILLIANWSNIFGNGLDFTNSDHNLESNGPAIGDYESGAEISTVLYDVPDLVKDQIYYYELIEDYEGKYDRFTFSIKGKEYSNEYPCGMICGQSIEPGKQVESGTEIQVIISLGPKEYFVPDVVGLSLEKAKIKLIENGFSLYNIEVIEKYDAESKPDVIIAQSPESNAVVPTEAHIKIYLNTYKGDEDDNDNNSSTTSSNDDSSTTTGTPNGNTQDE